MSILDEIRVAQRNAGEEAVLANLERMGLGLKMSEADTIEKLRKDAQAARVVAEKAWYALFCALPVGEERIHASDVYERIRCATRRND